MTSKCFRRRCNFVEDVAHMDEAVEVLRQHYRAVHPTKGFYANSAIERLEAFNLSAEEVLDQNNLGTDENPEYDWRQLRYWVQKERAPRNGVAYINEETLAEIERQVEEHFANQPQDAVPAPAARAPRIIWEEEVNRGVVNIPLDGPANVGDF